MGHGVTVAFTNTGGGDHAGADWTADGLTIAGVHYNIGTFNVSTGTTATISTDVELEVYADTITVVGTIQGNGRGFAGGVGYQSGFGPGGGGYGALDSGVAWGGGGGGGYGGAGGTGDAAGTGNGGGGTAYGTATDIALSKGSGGGGTQDSPSYKNTGGAGGAGVSLYANTLSVTGTITCVGGTASYNASSGVNHAGGGSGGGILLCGGSIVATGTLDAHGGNTSGGNGGAGGGGRIKVYYSSSINVAGLTTSVVVGTGAGPAVAGTVNTSLKLAQCTSAIPLGQTFTIGSDSAAMIEKVTLWVTTVNTSGDFILKVWDTTSKGTEYGTKTVTISATGSIDFTFADWIRLPDGEAACYMEISTAGTGDIEFGVYGISTLTGGDYYRNVNVVTHFDIYHIIYSVGHVKSVEVYNNAYTSVKADLANLMLIGAVYRVNVDNTGTIVYVDDFSTNKYLGDYSTILNVTHDAVNDELDIADDGYLSYLIDTKYPIDGIPTFTTQVDIVSGTPTIRISSNGSTWYDIDTAIVDDVSTVYALDNAASLSLDGLTTFYVQVDCAKGAPATCTIKSLQLDIATTTIDAVNPVIVPNITNTYKCDQDADSALACTVDLIYSEKRWA